MDPPRPCHNKPPASPRTGSVRRHRRTASVLAPPAHPAVAAALSSPPSFRVGGKTDPGRFVSQHQHNFLILGFHDEERSDDFSFGLVFNNRNMLSPVREQHDDGVWTDQTSKVFTYYGMLCLWVVVVVGGGVLRNLCVGVSKCAGERGENNTITQ